jgi:putative restriction endonuclease
MDEEPELETFSRGEALKREILKIYNYTCTIAGMRIDSAADISMVDVCHIVPFSVRYDVSPTNGIALCPNMHRAFERGLIAINDNYRVMGSKNFRVNFFE